MVKSTWTRARPGGRPVRADQTLRKGDEQLRVGRALYRDPLTRWSNGPPRPHDQTRVSNPGKKAPRAAGIALKSPAQEGAQDLHAEPAKQGLSKPDTPPEIALIIIIMCRHPPRVTGAFWALEGFAG